MADEATTPENATIPEAPEEVEVQAEQPTPAENQEVEVDHAPAEPVAEPAAPEAPAEAPAEEAK